MRLHGISYKAVDNTALQAAISSNASKDRISYLKQRIAYDAVFGFTYEEVPFENLANILCHDYGFSPFKYKSIEEGAIYNIDKHPTAYGRVRGRSNLFPTISWVCLDVDHSTLTDTEVHIVLSDFNHHIARTSNPSNPYKFRVILELTHSITIEPIYWKFFISNLSTALSLNVDNLAPSAVFYGYAGREVLSTIGKSAIDPSTYLNSAIMAYQELEDRRANALPVNKATKLLEHPYTTFLFAYEALPGEGTNKLLGAISKAKELGASYDYIKQLLYDINSFWDSSMPIARLEATVMTAI